MPEADSPNNNIVASPVPAVEEEPPLAALPGSMLRRARRAFGAGTPAEIAKQYRAIVGPTRSDDALVQSALEALNGGQKPGPRELAALELAIRVFRPAILSSRRVFAIRAEHRAAFPGWDGFCAAVTPHLYAVGRIDAGPKAPRSVPACVGTGFLVAPTVLVTNRHVLEVLSLSAMEIEPGMAVVNFHQEHGVVDDEEPAEVRALLAVHPTLDLALFAIAQQGALAGRAPFIVETAAPPIETPVVAVGYPFQDSERNPLFIEALFQSVFGLKRASPGEIIGARSDAIHHDCSTLGGSSGSPVLAMASGRVIGVHARGGFLVRNQAVSGAALATFIAPFL